MMDMNVKSTFFFIVETLDLLKNAGEGANIQLVSSIGSTKPNPAIGVYCMTKACLNSMADYL